MAELKLNGIPKNGGFLLSNKGPIDVRTVVTEYNHLTDLVSGNRAYAGMTVYVNNNTTRGLYLYDGTDWIALASVNDINIALGNLDALIGSGELSGGV